MPYCVISYMVLTLVKVLILLNQIQYKIMSKLLNIFTIWTICSASAYSQGISFQDLTLEQACQKAQKEDKKVMFLVYMNIDGFAKMMETTYKDKAVGEFYNQHFICIKKGVDRDAEGLAFMKDLGVLSSPTYLFFEPIVQEEIHRHQGRTANAQEFLDVGKAAAADFCTNWVEIIKDYPNGFENLIGEEIEHDISGWKYESKIQLPTILGMSIKKGRDAETGKLKKAKILGSLSEQLDLEKGLALLSAWTLTFAACDLSFIEAKNFQSIDDNDGAYSSKVFIPVEAPEQYKDLYIKIYLRPFFSEKKDQCRLFFEIGNWSK